MNKIVFHNIIINLNIYHLFLSKKNINIYIFFHFQDELVEPFKFFKITSQIISLFNHNLIDFME